MSNAPGESARAPNSGPNTGLIKSSLDLGAGLFLIFIALVGYIGAFSLRFGQLSSVGPGLLPKVVAFLVACFGLVLVVSSFFVPGPKLERWSVRGPFFVLGAVLLFAMTIRGSTLSFAGLSVHIPQLGLIVAGPLAIIFSAFADKETKPLEIVIFAAVLTAACIGIFKYALRLPIPIFPVGYGPF